MHAVVLLKQILDWELPPRKFRIDPATNCPPADLAPKLLGPFEQNALELALQLKDAGVVRKVTALLGGGETGAETLRKALSVRADEAVLVEYAADGPEVHRGTWIDASEIELDNPKPDADTADWADA